MVAPQRILAVHHVGPHTGTLLLRVKAKPPPPGAESACRRPRPPMPSSWRPAGTGGSGTCRGQALHAVGPGRVVLGLSAADNEVVLAGPVAFPFSWAASGLVVEAVGRASAAQGGGASVRGGRMHQLPAQRGAHDHHWSSMSPRKPATPAADHQFEDIQDNPAARPPGEGAAAVTERPDRPSSLGVARALLARGSLGVRWLSWTAPRAASSPAALHRREAFSTQRA